MQDSSEPLDEARKALLRAMGVQPPPPFAPHHWRGTYPIIVHDVATLREYAQIMLDITRHTAPGRALEVLNDAIANAAESLNRWSIPNRPKISTADTDRDARDVLREVIRGCDSAATGNEGQADAAREASDGLQTPEERALALLIAHPDWTDTAIAAAVGVVRTTVYKWDRFKQARKAMRATSVVPKGTKDGSTGDVEAWNDET